MGAAMMIDAGSSSPLVVIGLAGPMRSGKDSVAAALAPMGYWRVALADGIKSALDDLGGTQREAHKLIDAAGWTNRKAWQILGTEAREEIGAAHAWIELAMMKVAFLSGLLPEPQRIRRFVIPDVRYPAEALRLGEITEGPLGGRYETWRIARPGFGPSEAHGSERFTGVIEANRVICNRGSLEQLYKMAQMFGLDAASYRHATEAEHAG